MCFWDIYSYIPNYKIGHSILKRRFCLGNVIPNGVLANRATFITIA